LAIFGKTDAHPAAPGNGGSPPPVANVPTVVGPKARFVGDLFGEEEVLINGRFEGNVRVDRLVTIGPTGDLVGDVSARAVIVAGRVEGQIAAQERAELLASAAVHGSVQAPKVVIAEGAQLQGSVTMSGPAAAPAAPQAETNS
jgi:cytoskeletal protein CcmA (bactofilin family)